MASSTSTGSPRITLVGAGGMAFGPTMANDVIHTPGLRGATLVLHDVNGARLERAHRFAAKLNLAADNPVRILATTDARTALTGADFVLSSAEFGRFQYRIQDYEIPNRHGARQINGENGGPGAVFHSLRSIANTLSICDDIERFCPDALLINLSNPLSRVALAIEQHTSIRSVSMCHEMPNGVYRLSKYLKIPKSQIEAHAAGINHFTFFSELRDRRTGDDLLPKVRERFSEPFFDYAWPVVAATRISGRIGPLGAIADEFYFPLVVHMVREYGLVPTSIDSHIGEYLPFTADIGAWYPSRAHVMERTSRFAERASAWVAQTRVPLPLHRLRPSSEEVVPIIASMRTGEERRLMAVNVANDGYIPDVTAGAIVEVGATVDADGIHPDREPPVGDPVAGWIAAQLPLQQLLVDAAVQRDPELAFQALVADPLSPPDERACRAMFDEVCSLQRDVLPF